MPMKKPISMEDLESMNFTANFYKLPNLIEIRRKQIYIYAPSNGRSTLISMRVFIV